MPWSASYEKETEILITTLDGYCSLQDIQDAIMYSINFSKEHDTMLFMVDCTKFKSKDKTPTLNAYSLGQFFEDNNVSRKIREAIIVPMDENIRQNLQFFETTAANRGYKVKTFESIEKARIWLQP